MKLIFSLFVLCFAISYSYDLKPKWNPQHSSAGLGTQTVQTHESVVEINGSKYREIKFKSEIFYLKALDKQSSLQDEPDCWNLNRDSRPKVESGLGDGQEPFRIRSMVEVVNRTSIFLEGLRTKCQKVINPLDLNVGLSHQNKDKAKTNVFVNPFSQQVGLGFEKKNGDEKKVLVGPGSVGAGMNW